MAQIVFDTQHVVRYRFPTHTNDLILDRKDSEVAEAFLVRVEPGETVPLHVHSDAEQLFTRFHDLLTGPPDVKADGKGLGKLAVFCGVSEFPVRVKCASLPWHTMHAALEGKDEGVSTE